MVKGYQESAYQYCCLLASVDVEELMIRSGIRSEVRVRLDENNISG